MHRRRIRKLAIALLTVAVLYLGLCFMLSLSYMSPIRIRPTLPQGLVEDIAHGVPVWKTAGFGRGKVVFVMAHGLGGSRDTWGDLMLQLDVRGFDCIAPAMPGQEAHPERTIGLGIKEADTILSMVTWAREQYETPPKVILVGLSMGGAATWLASEKDPTVDAVVTEGAYARFDEAMDRFFDRSLPMGRLLLRPVVWFASAKSGISPGEVVPLTAAQKWKGRPALVIQGSDDDLILQSHAVRLAEASGAELWTVEKACHAQCMTVAGPEYVERLARLAERIQN